MNRVLYWTVIGSVIFFDINDTIRGFWFYHNFWYVLGWNLAAICAAYFIIEDYKKKWKKK
jgi:hypothetical protein